MFARCAQCRSGATKYQTAFLFLMALGPVHTGMAFLPAQHQTLRVAIEGVLPAAGEIIDCNENGIDDAQDIAELTSADCNANGVADECEIHDFSTAPGGPFFCTNQCDSDCNGSGVPDECELSGNDCNGDDRPDDCGAFVTCDDLAGLQEQSVRSADVGAANVFGGSVSISDGVAIVGAPCDFCGGVLGGCAYVFRLDGSTWVLDQQLFPSDASDGISFGASVFVRGDTVVVGSTGIGSPGTAGSGAAYVFRYDGANWVEEQKLFASDAHAAGSFGASVYLDGNRAVIGAIFEACQIGTSCGAAYVFLYDGTNWIEEQKLTASDAMLGQVFGDSVALSGDTVVVGAGRTSCADGISCGAAYVFEFDGTTWIERQKLAHPGALAFDSAGVSFDGETIVMGAVGRDCAAGENCGAVYVFQFDGTNWIETQELAASDAMAGDRFGAVAVSGDTIVVGASESDCPIGPRCATAYVFGYDGTNWVEQQKLRLSNSDSEQGHGGSVSLFGDTAFVGSRDLLQPVTRGTVSFFDLAGDDCDCNGVADQCDDGGCNDNGIPDSCDPDSDRDGVPDDCDVCAGADDTIDSDGDGVADGCDICPGIDGPLDSDGDGVPDDCDLCDNNVPNDCDVVSPILAAPPHDILKNRYISIQPHGDGGFNLGLDFDIRVRLASTLVNGVTAHGSYWWAAPPVNGAGLSPATCISVVTTTKPTTPPNWDDCPTLHLTGCPIIPTSTYEISAVVGGLLTGPPLVAQTQAKPGVRWHGDCVGHFNGSEWTGPNGSVNFDDVVAGIKTFLDPTAFNAAHLSVMDLVPNLNGTQINLIASIADIFDTILGFQGNEYPGPQVEQCP